MRSQPIEVIVYAPKSESGLQDLSQRVAQVHSDFVLRKIDALPCPQAQKRALLDAVIASANQRNQDAPVPKAKPCPRER